jgi:hypothetical protein
MFSIEFLSIHSTSLYSRRLPKSNPQNNFDFPYFQFRNDNLFRKSSVSLCLPIPLLLPSPLPLRNRWNSCTFRTCTSTPNIMKAPKVCVLPATSAAEQANPPTRSKLPATGAVSHPVICPKGPLIRALNSFLKTFSQILWCGLGIACRMILRSKIRSIRHLIRILLRILLRSMREIHRFSPFLVLHFYFI